MRYVYWSFVLVVALLLASFAASNRADVTIGLWPLPDLATLPLYAAVIGALIVGLGVGLLAGAGARASAWRTRRRLERKIAALEAELTRPVTLPAQTRLPVPAASR
jgi:uncharacterized integral membrane protein